jgi:hypothetical protein
MLSCSVLAVDTSLTNAVLLGFKEFVFEIIKKWDRSCHL